jgi:hypothetical protein
VKNIMNVGTFNFDADGASIKQRWARHEDSGNDVIKVELDNGFTMIYTKTPDGKFKDIDFSHELMKDSKGFYHANLANAKKDFHDYY